MRKYQKGFTIIELMVTLVVLAIVLAIAIPNFSRQVINNNSLALGEEFIAALNFARAEAVKRARSVSICASANSTACGNAANWSDGFIVFTDKAAETASSPEIDVILQVWSDFNQDAVIDVKRNGASQSFIRYTGLGTSARLDDPVTTIQVKMSGCTGEAAKNIRISASGAVAISPDSCQ